MFKLDQPRAEVFECGANGVHIDAQGNVALFLDVPMFFSEMPKVCPFLIRGTIFSEMPKVFGANGLPRDAQGNV